MTYSKDGIQAIETRYRGNRYRSRLEARWAAFFDGIGVDYVYEPDTFPLPGGWYLPDFWIPSWDVYAEIKPSHLNDIERRKCEDLSIAKQKPVIAIQGQPFLDEYRVNAFAVGFEHYHELSGVGWHMRFAECVSCETKKLVDIDSGGCFVNYDLRFRCCGDDTPPTSGLSIHDAFVSARSERFY